MNVVHQIHSTGNYFGSVTRRESVAGLTMALTTYGTIEVIPSHQHECPSFFLAVRGNHREQRHGFNRELVAGDVAFYAARECHSASVHGSRAAAFNIEVTPEASSWRMLLRLSTLDNAHVDGGHGSKAIVVTIFKEFSAKDSARLLAIEGLALLLAAHSERYSTQLRTGSASMARALELLYTCGGSSPTLGDLAGEAGMSATQFQRAFKRKHGMSPAAFLRKTRVERAAGLIAGTTRPISEIAAETGFFDHAHMCRAFANVFGHSPSEHRRYFSSAGALAKGRRP
jgi:AraC family transcriptional regulator